jgi:pimeloyl-ACP methyl ester carboxylesterase
MTGLAVLLTYTMATAQDTFFNSNGVQLRYVDQGSGPPVVLVHGYTSNIEHGWTKTGVLANLVRDHRVVAFDLRGHGKSEKPRDPKAYGQEMAMDIVRLMDHLRLPRAHIVGYSLGAVITAKLLTTNPDRFLTATLAGHAGARTWTPRDEEAARIAAAEMESDVPFRSLIMAIAPTGQPKPNEEVIRQRSRQLVEQNDRLALAAYNRNRGELVSTREHMAAVRVPMLGVIGSADGFITGMKELKTIAPALEMVVIDGAVHSSLDPRGTLRQPQFVNAVRTFIAAHERHATR